MMKDNIRVIKGLIMSMASRLVLRPLCLLPIRKNRVLFVSYRGKQYSCNPRAISEALQSVAGDKLEIGWAFHEPEKFRYLKQKGVRVMGDRTFEFYVYALTARVVCTNMYYKPYLPRRKGQFYLRTWHGGGAYKKVDRQEKMTRLRRLYIDMQQQGASLYLSSSRAFTEMTIRDSFGYTGEVMEEGMPRNDVLISGLSDAMLAETRAAIGLKPGERLVLYAPTYRDDIRHHTFNLDFDALSQALGERFGGDWVCAYRGHNFAVGDAAINVIDATDYPDMQRLLLIADALVTDYSSCIWDMSLMFKPVFLYATDLDKYARERAFYTDIRTWPFPLAQNNAELERAILDFDEAAYKERVKAHHDKLGICESGRASAKAAGRILKECGLEA